MTRIARALDTFWFVPATARPLALLRILVGLYALLYLLPRVRAFSSVAGGSQDVFVPVGLVSTLDSPIPVWLFQVILGLTLAANVLFVVGWRFKYSGPIFAGLLVWLLTYRNSWSMIYHSDNLMVLHVAVLGLTRSADTLSLDALAGRLPWRLSRAVLGSGVLNRGIHWEYGYPIRLLCTVAVITYVLAGIAKVAGPMGWAWGTGDTMRMQLAFDGLRKEMLSDGASSLTFLIFWNDFLTTMLGIGSLVIELGAPIALLSTPLGWAWAIGAFGMHWGIYAIMDIQFRYHMTGVAFASFFVSDGLLSWCKTWVHAVFRRLRTPLRWQPRRFRRRQSDYTPPEHALPESG